MKSNPEDETDLTRLIDGEFSDEEASALLRDHPEWAEPVTEARSLGDALRANVTIEKELPYADFFNHEVRRQIEGDVFSGERPSVVGADHDQASVAAGFPLFTRLRWLSGLGFVAMLGLLMTYVVGQNPGGRTEIVSLYTPEAGVSATTDYDDEAGATVIRLTGLQDIPATTVLGPHRQVVPADRLSLSDSVLFEFDSHELGRPVSVLSRDHSDQMPGAILIGF